MIPRMKPMLLAFDRQKLPGEIREAVRDTVEFCPVIGDAIVRYIIDHKGIVDAPHREKFITFFSVPWFTTETDHEEGTLRPIDSAGIMILAPEEVVASLKRQPWSRAARFVGNRTAKDAFERYARGGDSIPLLQKRYAANAAVIRAKWTELAKWVEVQQMKAGYSGE